MKKLFLLLGIIALIGCTTTERAVSYHFVPQHTNLHDGTYLNGISEEKLLEMNNPLFDVGKIQQIIERNGYSIVLLEKLSRPIYVNGRLNEIKSFDMDAYIWAEKVGKEIRFHLVHAHKRYVIDKDPKV